MSDLGSKQALKKLKIGDRVPIRVLDVNAATRQCSVWGTNKKLSAPHAALVNGTQVQGFELDDVHRAGVLHVGAVVLPALIAVTEMKPGMSGKEREQRFGQWDHVRQYGLDFADRIRAAGFEVELIRAADMPAADRQSMALGDILFRARKPAAAS